MKTVHDADSAAGWLSPDNLDGLKQLLVTLLAASQEPPSRPGRATDQLLAAYRSLAWTCAAILERLESPVKTGTDRGARPHSVPPHLLALLGSIPGGEPERVRRQWLYETGQYRALVEALDGMRPGFRPYGGKRRGMMPQNQRLAVHALALKEQGISWSCLLAAVIDNLEAAPQLDAEDQVLLHRLRDLQAVTRPIDSGAYLRLTVARYKADCAIREQATLRQVA